MPVTIRKVKGKYQVSTPHGVKAKGTTKAKAEAQERLLTAVEHGWKPTGKGGKPRGQNARLRAAAQTALRKSRKSKKKR